MTGAASSPRHRTLRWGARAACAILLVGAASGCALVPKLGPPPQVGPPYIPPPEPVWVVLDPALFAASDSLPATARSRQTPFRSRPSDIGPSPNPSGPIEAPSTAVDSPVPEHPTAAAPPETTTTPIPALSIDLPSSDRWQLSDAAHRNLSAADSLARGAARAPLGARDRAKLDNARGLMRQAEEALARGDLRAAANLAYKARLLAAEVAR